MFAAIKNSSKSLKLISASARLICNTDVGVILYVG
jgi:hypothetical protein